ncbi:MAG: GNAT family N-acetyltransferase [Oscillospiraceae bacterium]|nr:GNAT family N-acetyltransferase [Oscillospiraceae bacterium]
MKIEQVTDAETADACDELLTKLITDERETYNSNIPSDFTVSGWYRTTLSNTSRVTFAAVEAQQVVGFLHGFIKDDPAIQPEARLDAVFVEPAFRGQGIAGQFICQFQAWCRKKHIGFLDVSVWQQNHGAIALYRKNGFTAGLQILRMKLS